MKILVINSGSSSLKYRYILMEKKATVKKGIIERIGASQKLPNHREAFKIVLDNLKSGGALSDLGEIAAIGHRVVHGGETFLTPVLIEDKIIRQLDQLRDLAPLHNPPNIDGIKEFYNLMPQIPQVAVFDTAFHHTIPEKEYLYAIPQNYYRRYGIRKYGFHGSSHKYVSNQAADLLGYKNLNIISCHLGNGSSITAIKNGISIATSMGFTPLAGVVMGTRCGDIDPAVVFYLMEKENLVPADISRILNEKSGIMGLSEISSDFRDIEAAARKGEYKAQLAIEVFVHSVQKYIGSYVALLGGLDALIFTAGIGENSSGLRQKICHGLDFLGIELDTEKNLLNNQSEISKSGTRVKVLVIPTNEELMIAQETATVLENIKSTVY